MLMNFFTINPNICLIVNTTTYRIQKYDFEPSAVSPF